MKNILTIIIILALIGVGIWFGARTWRGEMQRMENNYLAAIEQLRNDNNDNMRVLDLKVCEIQRQYPEIKKQLQDMDIKLKNVETIQNVNTTTTNHVNTVLRDSTIQDTIKVRLADYNDKWVDFKLLIIDDSVSADYTTRDSLFIVLNRNPRNLWQWLRAEPRNVRSTVKSYNPNSNITYNRLIKIEK